MSPMQRRSASFIVRAWCESDRDADSTAGEWRFSIENVDAPDRVYLNHPSAIGDFIRHWIERGEHPDAGN